MLRRSCLRNSHRCRLKYRSVQLHPQYRHRRCWHKAFPAPHQLHRRVIYDSPRVDPDTAACVALVRDLLDPEEFGHSVTAEVRNAARRAFGIKGQQEGLAA